MGLSAETPRSLPAASDEVTTLFAPDWRSSGAFSACRTVTAMKAPGLTWRAVRVLSTAVSSRWVAMTIVLAVAASAFASTRLRVPSPWIAASPSSLACLSAVCCSSITTMSSGAVPWLSRVSAAERPLVPKPTMTVWSRIRRLQRLCRHCARVLSASTSRVVPTSTIRKTTRSGVMIRALTSRARSVTGTMSPYPVVERVTVA